MPSHKLVTLQLYDQRTLALSKRVRVLELTRDRLLKRLALLGAAKTSELAHLQKVEFSRELEALTKPPIIK